jgi:hypothetical protein
MTLAAETAKTPPPTLLFDNDSTWGLVRQRFHVVGS